MKKLIILFFFVSVIILVNLAFGAKTASASIFSAMTTTTKNVTATTVQTVSAIDGVDNATTDTSTTNTAQLAIQSSVTINNGGELSAGSLSIGTGGSVSIQTGGVLKIGKPIYITDSDADGWAGSWTLYDATASGRRRLGLMKSYTTLDCNDASYSITNQCSPSGGGDGNDGPITFSSNTNINTIYAPAYVVSSLGTNTITATTTPTGIAANDEIMLINLQGNSSYFGNVGNYENFYVSSVTGSTITLQTNITKIYGATTSNSNLTGQTIIVQRVPNWTNVTINSGVTLNANTWGGTGATGGLLAFRASGTVTVNGTIQVDKFGYLASRITSTNSPIGYGGESLCGINGGGLGSQGNTTGTNGPCGVGGGGGANAGSVYAPGNGSASQGGAGGEEGQP